MLWILAAFVGIALVFQLMARHFESRKKIPEMANAPLVSFLVCAYNAQDTITDTLQSIKEADYPRKEIIVVNDSNDKTCEIAKSFGARCVQNTSRTGKPASLNKAASMAKGEILFILDADTVVTKDAISKLVPWFGQENVGAVMPAYSVKNAARNFWTKLGEIDTYFINNLLKAHMFFGSLAIVRGCSVAVRKSALMKIGGFKQTLIEDVDMAAALRKAGYIIRFEPEARTMTNDPETVMGIGSQRFRWGKGALFTFLDHWRFYFSDKTFLMYFMPYAILMALVAANIFWLPTIQEVLLLLPLTIYASSLKGAALFLIIMFAIMASTISNVATTATVGSMAHMSLLTIGRQTAKDSVYVIPYVMIYVPIVMLFYAKGVISGIRDRNKSRMRLADWPRAN